MVPLLILALVSVTAADSSDVETLRHLDTLYPELEHSRTIYVVGEIFHNMMWFLFFVHHTHSLVSLVSSAYQSIVTLCHTDKMAMSGIISLVR